MQTGGMQALAHLSFTQAANFCALVQELVASVPVAEQFFMTSAPLAIAPLTPIIGVLPSAVWTSFAQGPMPKFA
jgi:hypothetical protein